MPILLLVAEIAMIYYFIQKFGVLNFFLLYAISTVLGFMIVNWVGTQSLKDFRSGQVTGANKSLISKGLLFISGLLLVVPSMGTKTIGLLFLIPPVRWLFALIFTNFLLKRVFGASSFIHQFNKPGFSFYYQSSRTNPFESQRNQNSEVGLNDEDTKVIDVKFRKVDDTKLIE